METAAHPVLDALDHLISESTRASVLSALHQGMPAERIIAAIERGILPAIEAVIPESARGTYASPTEGLLALVNAQGGCMRVDEACERLGGISRQAVNERIKRGSLVAAKMPSGQYAIPRWQFNTRGEVYDAVPAVVRVLMESPGYSPLNAFTFFLQPSPMLDERTPLAVMKAGGSNDLVIEAAREFGRT